MERPRIVPVAALSYGLAIVIPAFNEAATIGAVVANAQRFGAVFVVDDGSADATADVARANGAEVIRHERNRGYDGALQSGVARAVEQGFAVVLTMDADGQHRPEQVAEFMRAIDAGADVVIGVRDRRQRFAEHLFSGVSRLLWGIQDPLCGMKAYRSGIYRQRGHFDSYGSIGTELAIYAARCGARIAQVPVMTRERADTSRFDRTLRANWRILVAMLRAFHRTRRGRP
jgi:glycosyltransferase involved in cell wall biosynthesis